MKTGLIMEGGAMRGMFTAGVLDVFMENGIVFDGAVGVSAGAGFGCNYKSRQPGRAVRFNKKYCRDPRYAGFRSLITTGDIYGADFCYRVIPDELDPFDEKAFEENPMEFYVTCTDVRTGKAVYHKCLSGKGQERDWMRASASMPLVSRLVRIGDWILSDGGTADSIPVRFFEHLGYDRNVVILTQPRGFIKKINSLFPLMRVTLRKYPRFLEAEETRPIRYNQTLKYIAAREKEGKLLVIRPAAPLGIKHIEHHPEQLERVYQLGRKAALERLEEIRDYLNKEES